MASPHVWSKQQLYPLSIRAQLSNFPSLLPTYFWLEHSHIDIRTCKRNSKCGFYSGQPWIERKFYFCGRRGEWVSGTNLFSAKRTLCTEKISRAKALRRERPWLRREKRPVAHTGGCRRESWRIWDQGGGRGLDSVGFQNHSKEFHFYSIRGNGSFFSRELI